MASEAEALRIVEAAMEVEDPTSRDIFVAAQCAGDPTLLARVVTLLARDDTDFRLTPTDSFSRPLSVVDTIPERVGPYRIIGEIARGGMGAVVKAERDDGVFQQTVAIKLIRGDLASARARTRFAEERRILARLRHPGIVRSCCNGAALQACRTRRADRRPSGPAMQSDDCRGSRRQHIAAIRARYRPGRN